MDIDSESNTDESNKFDTDDEDEFTFLHIIQSSMQAASSVVGKLKKKGKRGGSVKGKSPNKNRNHALGHQRLVDDYFSVNPVYDERTFRRQFRMKKNLFLRIVQAVQEQDPSFCQKKDATGKLGLSSLQKVASSIWLLAYGIAANSVDKYLQIAESTALSYLKKFCLAINGKFGEEYIQQPTVDDLKRITKENERRGFPGMIGSIDCCHWEWKNCPSGWNGMYVGKEKGPTVVLEAVALYDLWIWHAFFGMPGSHNNINVMDHSPIWQEIAKGRAPVIEFTINNHIYHIPYFLADGIYPPYATLVTPYDSPVDNKHKVIINC